jgi:hypothetical protein
MNFLSKIKLTISQYAILSLVAVVGALIVMLRLKGSQLHELKLKLMEKELDIATSKDDANIKQKKKKLKEAKKELKGSK